jgi:hypothetical protein
VSLLGAMFLEGIEFDFSAGAVTTLGPSELVVLVKDLEAFQSRYDTSGMKIAGEYRGNLGNEGDHLVLNDGRGQTILAFDYDDLWYPETTGAGYSLNILDPGGDPSTWGLAGSWGPSKNIGGSPGTPEGAPPPGGLQLPGDANQDSRLDVSDAFGMILYLYSGAARAAPCAGAIDQGGNLALLDVTGDGRLDGSDPIAALTYMFRQGPPPARGTACVRIPDCPDACLR